MRLEQMLVLQPVKRYQVSWFNGGINAIVSSRFPGEKCYCLLVNSSTYSLQYRWIWKRTGCSFILSFHKNQNDNSFTFYMRGMMRGDRSIGHSPLARSSDMHMGQDLSPSQRRARYIHKRLLTLGTPANSDGRRPPASRAYSLHDRSAVAVPIATGTACQPQCSVVSALSGATCWSDEPSLHY